MRQSNSWVSILAVIFSMLSSLGCAINKAATRGELSTISSLTVVRYPTPAITRETSGAALAGFILFGGLGAAAAMAATTERGEAPLEFGQLILQAFMQRVAQEIPEWPAMTVVERPVDERSMPTGPTLALRIGLFHLSTYYSGLEADATIEMARAGGEVIWRKSFRYTSRVYDRNRSPDEFKADDNKLLKEELRFAADRIADEFIKDLKGSK